MKINYKLNISIILIILILLVSLPFNLAYSGEYSKQTSNFNIADLQDVFNKLTDDGYVTRKTTMIIPSSVSAEMDTAINRFKETLVEEFGNEITFVDQNTVSCNDVNYFAKLKGTPLVIVGDQTNNKVLKECYPSYSLKDSMFVSKNVFDNDEYALVVNTNDPEIVSFYAMLIGTQQYKNVEAAGMTVTDKIILASGGVLIVVGTISSITGVGAVVGVPLMYAGYVLSGVGTVNECYVKNEGGHNWGGCAFDVGTTITAAIGGKLIGALIKNYGDDIAKLVGKNVNKLAGHVNPKALSKVVGSGDEAVAVSKEISDGIEVFAKKGIPAEQVLKQLPKEMDDLAKVRFFKSLGEFLKGQKAVQFDDLVTKGTKNKEQVLINLGNDAKKVYADPISDLQEAIQMEQFVKRGGSLKYTEQALQKAANGGKHTDFVVNFEGSLHSVEIKSFPQKPSISVEVAENNIKNVFSDYLSKINNLPPENYKSHILNIIVKSPDEANNIIQAAKNLQSSDPTKWKDIQVIVNSVEEWVIGT
ncbi:hypothetical protein HYY69_00155 [Candidatus Woesearchaeota archaeon]|nr:hypothetical protein [Candidatus Woesearchaeota archaeon]